MEQHQKKVKNIERMSDRIYSDRKKTKKKPLKKRMNNVCDAALKPCRVSIKKLSSNDIGKFNCRNPHIDERRPVASNTYNFCDIVFQNPKKECNHETVDSSESERTRCLIYRDIINCLHKGTKIDEINFDKYFKCIVKRDQVSTQESKRSEDLHRLLRTSVCEAVFRCPSKCKSPVIKDVKKFIYNNIPLDGSENKQVACLVTIIRACKLKAKNGMDYCVKYPEVPVDKGKHELHNDDKECDDCKLFFLSDSDFCNHRCDRKLVDGYQCLFCEKVFRYKKRYKRHLKIHTFRYKQLSISMNFK